MFLQCQQFCNNFLKQQKKAEYVLRGSPYMHVQNVRLGHNAQFTPPARHDKTVLSVSARPPDKCVLRRSASGGRTAPPDTLRHRPDTERTCLAVLPTQFTLPHETRQNSPVCFVSGVAVWISFNAQAHMKTVVPQSAATPITCSSRAHSTSISRCFNSFALLDFRPDNITGLTHTYENAHHCKSKLTRLLNWW